MLFKVKLCLVSRVSEDSQDVPRDQCRLNGEAPHEPEPPLRGCLLGTVSVTHCQAHQ